MFDSADEDHDGAQDKMQTKIKVDHSGTNRWLAPSIIKSSCKINVRYFPFDEQVRIRKGIPIHIPWNRLSYRVVRLILTQLHR